MKTYIFLFSLLALSGIAYAKTSEVEVYKTVSVPITANVTVIESKTVIDLTLPFSDADAVKIQKNLNLTKEEKDVHNKVLKGEVVKYSERADYISLLNKQVNATTTVDKFDNSIVKQEMLSSDEKKYILGMKGSKNTNNKILYLSRKSLLDNP